MRMKLVAATAVVVAAMGLTGGAVWLSKADAQPPGGGAGGPPGMGGSSGPPPGGFFPGGGGPSGAPVGAPPGGGGPPVAGGGPAAGGWNWAGAALATWEYKFVDAKNDRKAFEAAITQHGKEGWEFCSSERFAQGELVLVFKKKKGGDFGGVGGINVPGIGGGWRGDWRDIVRGAAGGDVDALTLRLKHASASDVAAALQKLIGKDVTVVAEPNSNTIVVVGGTAAIKDARKLIEELDTKAAKPAPPGGGMPMPAGGPQPPAGNLTIIALRNATAAETATVLKKVFPAAEVTPEPRSNQLIIRADTKTLEELKALLAKLDVALPNVPLPK